METKTCTRCQQPKPLSSFYTQKPGKVFARCKECTKAYNREWKAKNPEKGRESQKQWNKTVNGYRHSMWNTMNQRCGNHPAYRNIKVQMTKEEWYDFATPLLERFFHDHPADTPSVDRIDPKGHYEINNLQIISWRENLCKSSVFAERLGVSKDAKKSERLNALRAILEGQCELLSLPYHSTIKWLYENS